MDLGTIHTKLYDGVYKTKEEFNKDVELVFTNAMKFKGIFNAALAFRQAAF